MRMTRRQFLLAAGVLVAIERLHGLILAQAIEARMLRDAATSGRRFLVNLLDPAVGLLPEFPGSNTYWLFHDNDLAVTVFPAPIRAWQTRSGGRFTAAGSPNRGRSRSSSAK